MSGDKPFVLCLCVEDVDNCDILLNQIGGGHVFGPNQHISLMLQSADRIQLESLCYDIQDCAFPLISGISTHATLNGVSHHPDAIMVLLANRPDSENAHLQDLLGLVQYTSGLADVMKGPSLAKAPVVLLGDLAHTAASLLSSQLATPLGEGQVLALSGEEGHTKSRLTGRTQGQMGKVTRLCHALTQWWTGVQAHPEKKTVLGTKFVDTKRHRTQEQSTGYFFSGPVDLTGPMAFSARPSLGIDSSHVAEVKAETDMALSLAGLTRDVEKSSSYHMAHL